MNIPFNYNYINAETARKNPNTMHARNTFLSRFFQRYLTQKAISVINFNNIPQHWEKNYFIYGLYYWGHVAILETDKFGIIPQWCTLYGYNVFYQPTHAIITNPAFSRSYTLQIGTETEIVKLSPDYGGIYDLISYYADLLAITAETMGVNILASKLAYVFAASGKASAESFKKLFDMIASGEPAAVIDKDLLDDEGKPNWQYFSQDLSKNYIAPDLLQTMRQLEQKFDTIIGIPNANTDKRERLLTDEVNANNIETESRVNLWLNTINDDLERVNKMFGTRITAKINSMEGFNNDSFNIINSRSL